MLHRMRKRGATILDWMVSESRRGLRMKLVSHGSGTMLRQNRWRGLVTWTGSRGHRNASCHAYANASVLAKFPCRAPSTEKMIRLEGERHLHVPYKLLP